MKVSVWTHHGMISISSIKKKTGAIKVLVPVDERRNIIGTALIGYGFRLEGSDGHHVETYIEGVMPVWEFISKENQQHATILPRYLVPIERQKAAIYRIVQLGKKFLWVESEGKLHKAGRPFTLNEFILVHPEEKK
jgi:hypothetical protein